MAKGLRKPVVGLYLSIVHQVLPTLETGVEFWDPPWSDDLRTV